MKSISLKLNDEIYKETESLLQDLKTSRNKYINEAIRYYNHLQKSRLIEKQLALESKMIYKDSMLILHDFERLQDEM